MNHKITANFLAAMSLFLVSSAGAADMNLLPNGGFEICDHLGATRLAWQTKAGMTFDSPDPVLPLRWVWWSPNNAVDMRLSPDAHGGKHSLRLACPKAGLSMEMQVIEVVPGATYSFGGWAKGKGQGRVTVFGNAYEGRKELAGVDLAVKPDWTEARAKVTIPGNIRTICFGLNVNAADPVLLDDIFFSADVEKPFDVDAVMTTKFKKDDHTVLLVDFDGQGEYRLESKSTLTDDKGGRFGKGARLSEQDVSSVVMPLAIKEMPAEGTLEFWFSPDGDPTRPLNYLSVLSADQEIMYFGTGDTLNLVWPAEDNKYRSINWCDPHANHVWISKGSWHHVAMEWDKEAVRLYVDGGLAGMTTARPLPFAKLPSALKMGASWPGNAWSGVVDEIRLSDIKRYGPVIPAGATWRPLPIVAAPQETPKVAAAASSSAPDFAKERKAMIGTIPPAPAGSIAFDASGVKPLVQDDKDFQILPDTPVKGMTVARVSSRFIELLRTPDYDGGYWTLKGVPAGKYYVGIWYESSTEGLEAPQQYNGRIWVYLNGRAVQLATHSEPVQVSPGVYYVEAQSKTAESIKDGDEIEVLGAAWQPIKVARLTLHTKEPPRGHGWMFENYGPVRDRSLRLIAYCGYRMGEGKGIWNHSCGMDNECDSPESLKKAPDGKALAYYWVANPLTVPLTVKCKAEIRAYFREIVGSEETTLTLKPHERITREIPFSLLADSRRYSMNVNVEAVNPPALDWPKADTIELLKGVRQSVPWHDAFRNEFRRCMSFRQSVPGVRQDISLNGKWETAFTPVPTAPAFPPSADLKWLERDVPFTVGGHNEKPPAHALYARRKVTLPADTGQRTWRLLIGAVLDEATAYVNGKKVGNVRGSHTPLLCDVTDALTPGENEIVIVIRDALAVMDPAYVNPNNPTVTYQYLDAPGQGYGNAFAIYSGVRLISSPMVTAEDLQVVTSVRKKVVSARFNVTNREKAARKLTIKASVLDAGKPVMAVGQATIEVPAGASKPVNLDARWADPVLWGPASPKLYTLAVEVADETGQKLDLLRERFGFRECWIENGRIMLNGAPVRLKGSNCGGGGGTVGGDDVQWTRGSDGMEDFLDEFGCLTGLYTLGGLGNTPSRHNIERDVFWETERKNVLKGAAQFVNHPCLIAWDLSNEWLGYCTYSGGDPLFGARRFKTVGDALMAYDPSRWIIFDGDGDLMGLWDTQAEHYMIAYNNNDMRGHSGYLPDSRFWRPLDQDFNPAEARSGYNREVVYRTDKKVVMNTENSWKVDGLQPPGLSFVMDEDDVLSPAIDSGRGAALWYWKQNVDGHRDMGASIVCNYTMVTGLNYRGHMIQCFIMPEHSHHYFSGQKFHRRYSLHNDLLVKSEYDFHWSLVDSQGTVLTQNHDKRPMDSGDLQRGQLDLDLPVVKQRTLYTLHLELLADGKFAYGEDRDIEVWPDTVPAAPALTRKIMLFDPVGKTTDVFTKAGIAFTKLDKLAAPESKPTDTVLVLGEGAVQGSENAAVGALSAFTEAGGRIVVLMQNKLLPGLPIRTTLEPHEWCSMTFLRTPQHPILKALQSWDLQFWSPDHVLAQGSYTRPDEGSFVSLIDGAGDHDRSARSAMDWNQLMECYRGQGSYLLCQLPVVAKYDVEPMARELLVRIIGYEANEAAFRSPTGTLAVVDAPDGVVASRLRDMNVKFQIVKPSDPMGAQSTLLVDAATLPKDFEAPQAWKEALAQGATIMVHGAAPAEKPLLESLAGKTVQMTVQPYAMWEGRGFRNGFTWLTAGLSHIDLYWKDYDGSEGGVWQAEQPKYKIEDLCYWSVKADGAVEHVYPSALVEIPVGRGKLIVDQIRWETQHKKLDRLTVRVASVLMTSLNIGIAPYMAPRSLPADVVYKPVDLSSFCNRGFKDDVGDDGKGGWPDQGPKADMREFPTGDQNLGGVPFAIGKEPRTCIVLKSNRRPFPDLYPDEATIPLGFAVEGLFFLHSTAWGGQEPTGRYQIQYADGTVAEITLVENENILGWNRAPSEFPRERGTQSHVVWTGATELFPAICVCRMLWVNPKPDVPVKAVRFSNPPHNLCPVLIGITAAVKPGRADIEAVASAQSKAREWLKKGIAAADAGKDVEAQAALLEAIKADPKLDAAHQRLCELAERGHDEKAVLAAYKAWAASSPRTPLPYNKIGEMLEKQGDAKGALDAYTKSLEVEWNQPPTIEAKSRLTLQLKK